MSLTNCVPNPKSISRRQFLQAFAPFGQTEANPITPDVALFQEYIPQAPKINAAYWALVINGFHSAPLSFSYDDLQQFPMSIQPCTLVCAAKPTQRISHAQWEGIRLKALLSQSEINPAARYANLFAANGYSTSLPITALENALIAFKLNGEPLSAAQGFPARLIVPGHYAHKMPLWLRRISLSETPVNGYWERQGYALAGEVEPTTSIFTPQPSTKGLQLHGAAYAGKQAITQVAISINQGDWRPIHLQNSQPFTWSRWKTTWQPPLHAAYTLRVWAEDALGRRSPIQESTIDYTKGLR